MYGTTLRLPGAFFSTPAVDSDPSGYVTDLRNRMRALKATPPRPAVNVSPRVSNALNDATHVFVRHDAVRKPLQPPYDGPFRVLSRSDNYYTLDINGRTDTVTLCRLKPAYLEPGHYRTRCFTSELYPYTCPTLSPYRAQARCQGRRNMSQPGRAEIKWANLDCR